MADAMDNQEQAIAMSLGSMQCPT